MKLSLVDDMCSRSPNCGAYALRAAFERLTINVQDQAIPAPITILLENTCQVTEGRKSDKPLSRASKVLPDRRT